MGLRDYIIRRILLLIPVVFGVVILVFAIIQLVPVNSRVAVFVSSGNPKELRPEVIQALIHENGLDQPVWVQFRNWLDDMLHGNFGYSEVWNSAVLPDLIRRAPATAEIVIISAPIIIFVGIFLGVISATHRDKPLDHASRVLSILGTSLPSFFFGVILSAIFIAQLGWVSTGRLSYTLEGQLLVDQSRGLYNSYTGFLLVDTLLNGRFFYFVDALKHLILPATVLVFIQTAVLVRVTRSSMLEALSKTYIVAARAKGLSNKEVINKHARKNALIPVVTLSGLMVGGMMTGLIITETIFRFPGLGNWAARSAQLFDMPVVACYAMFSAIVFVLANLIVDILYAYLDPRIRLG
jgi:dipeptide transport system permease protein